MLHNLYSCTFKIKKNKDVDISVFCSMFLNVTLTKICYIGNQKNPKSTLIV